MERTFLAIHFADTNPRRIERHVGDPADGATCTLLANGVFTLQLRKQLHFYPLSRNGWLPAGGAFTQVKV
jgi:hypothetical protein